MDATTRALIWEIWGRRRLPIYWVIGMTAAGMLSLLLPENYRTSANNALGFAIVTWHLFVPSLLLVFVIFSYDESSAETNSTCFPRRLFTLPVSTFKLVALPMILGVGAIELVYWIWIGVIIPGNGHKLAGGILFGGYMAAYQLGLWTLGRLGPLRLVILALVGMLFFVVGIQVGFDDSFFNEQSV